MVTDISVSVQAEDFDQGLEYQHLVADNVKNGAVITFVGMVRDFNHNNGVSHQVTGLHLEHYPGMTEKSLQDIARQAQQQWQLGRVRVIHRFGSLALGEQIVFVGVSAMHRKAAFEGAECIMDYLKTQAPFWKKEQTQTGQHWVEARQSDSNAANKWNKY